MLKTYLSSHNTLRKITRELQELKLKLSLRLLSHSSSHKKSLEGDRNIYPQGAIL
ncbi:hypothetical protein [Calothrix sp. FACHB-1219]|uniref:hypothetical protein n=1 Tax=Calothrix sp. FACHB-1219 TaxID=2692778 RepID=UPI0030D8003B